MDPPAYRLEGLELDGGWHVEKRIDPPVGATGGNFSCGYHVTRSDGTRGFLKALDFSRALAEKDPSRALEPLINAYNFERTLLGKCRTRNMDRIVLALADGSVQVDASSPIGIVQYVIFECAECDLRIRLHLLGDLELAWKLRSLHHIATGLSQLHGQQVAHQDVKPSNVLVFDGKTLKIADLGSASVRGSGGPRDHWPFAGDPAYAPIEALYGYLDPEWTVRRQGCDLWHLGSMAVFLFTGATMNSLILQEIPNPMRPKAWTGSFADAIPYVTDAFGRVLDTFGSHVTDQRLRGDLVDIVRHLCDPDPKRRGHPVNVAQGGNPFAVERYVSWFDLLARRAELGLFGKL
jgi:serine/threonine protein kinase